MANSWSKEDRSHYEKSEVWQELEQIVLDTVRRADILQQKLNEKTARWEGMDAAKAGAAQAVCEQRGGCKDADDGASDEASDEVAEQAFAEDFAMEEEDNEASDELQNEVIDDLSRLVMAALAEGNIKLAYKIERTIDEILEQDVACE